MQHSSCLMASPRCVNYSTLGGAVETAGRQHPRFIEIVLVQSIFGLFFCVILDGGVLVTAYMIPLAAYWASVVVLSVRVRGRYSARDVAYVNRAWLVIVPAGMVAVLFIHGWALTL